MNIRLAVVAVALFSVFFSTISRADEIDAKAESFAKLYVSLCMKNLTRLDALRSDLTQNKLPKLPPEKATLFLNGSDGDAWPVPVQGDFGNFVLALPAGNNLCVVFARRIKQTDVERRFVDITSQAPQPLTAEKKIDTKLDTTPNGGTHTVSYMWSIPQAQRKMLFTLTTAAADDVQIQAMASAAMVSE